MTTWTAVRNYEEMSKLGAELIFNKTSECLRQKNTCLLGLATGNTMIRLYELLAAMFNDHNTDLSGLMTCNLDEYATADGREVPPKHPLSYRKYMDEKLFSKFQPARHFDQARAFFPPAQNAASYDDLIARHGGLDLQLLGIGFNGHIAFNEPMSEKIINADAFAALPSRVIALEPLTIATNARLTADNDPSMVPTKAITMGMKSILAAKQILLLACFEEQERPLSVIKSGRVTPELPASFLLKHPNSQIVYTKDSIATL